MDRSPRTLTLRQIRTVCTQREPTGRVIIVIVAERGEGRERRQEREERKREKRTQTSPLHQPTHLPSLLSVCRFKTSPCVGSKRFRVYLQNAHVYQHARVLPVHTETFLTDTRGVFRVPSCATHTTPHTQHTPRTHTTDTTHHTLRTNTSTNTTHDDTAQHTTTPKHKTHISHTPSTYTTLTLDTHAQHTTHTHAHTHDTYTYHTTPHNAHKHHTKIQCSIDNRP